MPYHHVVNRQAESTNKVTINNLKKRLEESKVKRPEVLPGVLWAYCTIAKTCTGETPFSLVYGAETLIQVEIGDPNTRYTQATKESNEEQIRINLDLLEKKKRSGFNKVGSAAKNYRAILQSKSSSQILQDWGLRLQKGFLIIKAANAGK
ncbi:uncharacterized protein [Nicotiana sylvestris]|uniref:uncharacterized protein n=1 Tax=Nicotiana sylvestris TaxID=4096 RepID=UPI00388C7C1A